MPLRRKFVLEPIITKPTKEMTQVKDYKDSLKFMSSSQIDSLYDELDVTDFEPKITIEEPMGGRKIAKVETDGKTVYFFKSSGTSRTLVNTKDYWFPCAGNCLYPVEPFSEKRNERIRKLEDKYLDMDDTLLAQELKDDPMLMKYKRFVTKTNAMISKKLRIR